MKLLFWTLLIIIDRAQQNDEASTAADVASEVEAREAEVMLLNRKQAALQHEIRLQKEEYAVTAEKLKA